MQSVNSETSVDELVGMLVKHQALEIAACEREDIVGANRHVDKLSAILDQLARTVAGRQALEGLMSHEMPEIRLRAAGAAMAWAPEMAIPVLGRLVADWQPKDPRRGYVAVRTEAKGWLYDYFGITDFDQNKLIEPLRAYGIDLPFRDQSGWQ
jgi:hypothetical protein